MTWRIDALDVRGGIAFASEREPDLMSIEEGDWRIDPAAPSVVLSAPAFLAEPTPNRGVGLAAARGAFQYGLFVDGEEVPFASLEDLGEFVRRAYLRSSGGSDDTGGGLPPLGPAPEGEGGGERDLPPEPYPEGASAQILGWGKAFSSAIGKAETGAPGVQVAELFPAFRAGDHDVADQNGPLVAGLKLLVAELLARRPRDLNGPSGAAWFRSAGALGDLIARLALIQDLIDAVSRPSQFKRDVDQAVFAIGRILPDRIASSAEALIVFMVALGANADFWLTRDIIRHRGWYWWGRTQLLISDEDILSLLQAIPAPAPARRLLVGAGVPPERQNLMNLLPAVLASPQGLAAEPALANLLLVISAALTVNDARRVANPLDRLQGGSGNAIAILQVAGDWLRDAFPRIALSKALERIIEEDALGAAYEGEA